MGRRRSDGSALSLLESSQRRQHPDRVSMLACLKVSDTVSIRFTGIFIGLPGRCPVAVAMRMPSNKKRARLICLTLWFIGAEEENELPRALNPPNFKSDASLKLVIVSHYRIKLNRPDLTLRLTS